MPRIGSQQRVFSNKALFFVYFLAIVKSWNGLGVSMLFRCCLGHIKILRSFLMLIFTSFIEPCIEMH